MAKGKEIVWLNLQLLRLGLSSQHGSEEERPDRSP